MAKPGPTLQGVPTAERVLLGADDAEKYLGINTNNRNIRESKVRKYTADMLRGEWLETGEPIKVSKTGTLLDGQHRLLALVRAAAQGMFIDGQELESQPDIQIPFFVITGLDDIAQQAMDIGAPRRLSDALALPPRGEKNVLNLAAALRIVHAWKAGYRRQLAKMDLASNATLLRFFDENADTFRDLVAHTSGSRARRIKLSPSVLSLVWYILTEIDYEEAEFFFERLGDGQGLVKGDPIYELREALERLDRETGRRPVIYPVALVIKAWNAQRNGEKIGLLGFKMGGKSPERFPEPV